jgi:hypothetical protein
MIKETKIVNSRTSLSKSGSRASGNVLEMPISTRIFGLHQVVLLLVSHTWKTCLACTRPLLYNNQTGIYEASSGPS